MSQFKIRLLSELDLMEVAGGRKLDEPEVYADGEENTWTNEYIYEVAMLSDRRENRKASPSEPTTFTQIIQTFIVRTWFEASGHGEMDIDPTPDGATIIEVHGQTTTVAGLVEAACLVGWIASDLRIWVEITPEFVKDAQEQFAFPETR